MNKWVLVAITSLALAACNDNDDPQSLSGNTSGNTSKPPVATVDGFTTYVQAEAATSPDDTEAKDIDSIALATPEDAEPISLN